MIILNLGCGTKASSYPEVINIDWSIYLRLKRSNLFRPLVPFFIGGERLNKFMSIPDNIAVYNLAKGIPYNSNSVDVVYHSHLLEHLDRDIAEKFLKEVKRVLKPDGVHRIVVPNFEEMCRVYLYHIAICENYIDEAIHHDNYIAAIIEQSVRKEAYGTGQQKIWRRHIENILLGDARRRGETHQWMYDKISLRTLLVKLGYRNIQIQNYNTSKIFDWTKYGLDTDEDGNEYKPGSLYIEAQK